MCPALLLVSHLLAQPWSSGFSHLDDPSSREELAALTTHSNLWDLSPRQRAIVLHFMAINARRVFEDARAAVMPSFTEAAAKLVEAEIACDVSLLQTKAVIGMTINGAAKHAALLDKLGVRIVVVEEAAEINEALTRRCIACLD